MHTDCFILKSSHNAALCPESKCKCNHIIGKLSLKKNESENIEKQLFI